MNDRLMQPGRGRILGIDYGTKRIGVAVSDPLQIIAQAVTTVENKSTAQVMNRLQTMMSQYEITEVVIGHPLKMDGAAYSTTKQVERFAQILQKESKLKVTLMDERFTSKIAKNALKEMGQSASRNKPRVDKIAAAVMLQTYLDRLHSQKLQTQL